VGVDRDRQADERRRDVARLVNEADELARQVVNAPDAASVYRKGIDLLRLGMGRVGTSDALDAVAAPLYLIWGALTDAVDGPGASPDPTATAERMRRAAREWLAVGEDADARHAYLDSWAYDECRYERPDADS
jgi:hypothetical protein